MDVQQSFKELLELFNRIVNKYNTLNKQPLDYGTGELLHPSEIHTLVAVGKYANSNITELGIKLGITKSAASQIILKLTKKGLLRRYKAIDNSKNILIALTDRGEAAVRGFQDFRAGMFNELVEQLGDMEENQVEFIHTVFTMIDGHLDFKLDKYCS